MSGGNGHNGNRALKLGTKADAFERVGAASDRQLTRSRENAVGGHREYRLRVTCFLPLNSEQQALAIDKFVEYLQAHAESDEFRVEGFTMSDSLSAPWIGYWYSRDQEQWIEDRIVLCIIDFRVRTGRSSAPRCMATIKRIIAHFYREYAGAEEDIWITAQPVFRHK